MAREWPTRTWPSPAGARRPRHRRAIRTRTSTSSTTSTTAGTATAGAGSRTSPAKAGCRSNWRSATRDRPRSSGAATAKQKFRDRWRRTTAIEVAADGKAWVTVARLVRIAALTRRPTPESETLARRAQTSSQARITSRRAIAEVYAGDISSAGADAVPERGDPMQPGDRSRRRPQVSVRRWCCLSTPENRTGRAGRWIADPTNPLPARVMVNRLWHYHFGRGIVGTPSDFGHNGDQPSHPELLDWLAPNFEPTAAG